MKYRVTILTPTLAGDGQRLSPIDYMVWKDQVNVIDQRRIFKMLAKSPRLEPYLVQIRRATRLDFASWGGYAQNYALRRIPFEHPSLTAAWERARVENLHIPTFATDFAGPLIAGSAIKGAVRTAATVERWRSRGVEKVIETAAKRAEGRVPRFLAQFADNESPRASFADARLVSGELKVYQVQTSRLQNGVLSWKDSMPAFAEMAVPGTVFEGRWSGELPPLGESSALLENQIVYAKEAKLAHVAATLEALRGRPGLLSLGWGGGFLSKTAASDTSPEAYRQILRAMPYYARAIQTGLAFPKTRRIVTMDQKPAAIPGWISLEPAD
ncbi:MAG: RAMP superfamily CRISPR-associated protein [Bryobacteraceae bacterium]|nr:RAMP superfamily CRISPR-associated protein [Bryobacteraceae bacterium]